MFVVRCSCDSFVVLVDDSLISVDDDLSEANIVDRSSYFREFFDDAVSLDGVRLGIVNRIHDVFIEFCSDNCICFRSILSEWTPTYDAS